MPSPDPPPPHWTRTPPTEPGYYWHLRRFGGRGIVSVEADGDGGLMVASGFNRWPLRDYGGSWWPASIVPPPIPDEGTEETTP